jgi:hypothetical protein
MATVALALFVESATQTLRFHFDELLIEAQFCFTLELAFPVSGSRAGAISNEILNGSVDIPSPRAVPHHRVIPNPRSLCGVRDLLFAFGSRLTEDPNKAILNL